MNNLVRDALMAHLPPGTRGRPYNGATKYTFDCPGCIPRGHSRDRTKRGSVFVNPDGSTGYDCFQCQLRTRQDPNKPLTKKMDELLGYMGMSEEDRLKLGFHVGQAIFARNNGPTIKKRDLPSGAILIKHLVANPPDDQNFRDVMADLADMSEEIRDSYYWTAEPGASGDMNRRYIWFFGTTHDPVGWAAKTIDDRDAEDILSDPNIWLHDDGDR
ncbi:hypothetical protein [Sphingomonas sp. M1A8_2b]